MSTERQSIDISDSSDLLELAEEVQRSGIARLLKRGEQDLALLVPIAPRSEARPRPARDKRDALLNIIGLGESVQPTDIAHDEGEYLADLRETPRQSS